MTRKDRPTLAPAFDMEKYARESDARIRAQPAHDGGPELQTAENPADADAEEIYRARIGDMQQVVVLSRPAEDLLHLRHGVADGFVLSTVDGRRTVEELLRDCGLPPLAALSTLFELLETGVLALRPR